MEAQPWYAPSHDESFDRRVIRAVVTVLVAVFAILLIYRLRTPLLWLVIAVFVAIAVSGPVNALSKHIPRLASIGLVYTLIILVPVAIVAALLPPLVNSGTNLVAAMPGYINDFQQNIASDEHFQKVNENFDLQGQLTTLQKDLASRVGDAAGVLSSIGEWLINSIFAAFTIFILSIFMVARGRDWGQAIVRRRPGPEGAALERSFQRIGGSVSRYIGGALLQAFIAGLAAFIMLSILGVPSPLVLAVIVAIFDVIPMVGSTIAGLVVGAVTLFVGFPLVTIIWAVFVIAYQQFENYVIQPKIQSEAVDMEPFIVLIAVLFGGTLMGVVGAILAIPIAATIMIAIQEWHTFKRELLEMNSGEPAPDDQSAGDSGLDEKSAEPEPAG